MALRHHTDAGAENGVGFLAPRAVYRYPDPSGSEKEVFVVAVDASDEETAAHERAMVLRYCTRVTGDRGTAEDLTQQALLEAWQKSAHPHSATVREAWLRGVARNVCLRWARGRGSTAARLVRLAEPWGDMDGRLAGDSNLEAKFERADLARLLERAMALVPPETREVLVQKYIEESPQAAVAARLGLSEGAVEARLARGKRALRRLFTTTLAADARSYGLISPDDVGWRETRIWCPDCGQRRLVGRFTDGHDLQLDCPDCLGQGRVIQVHGSLTCSAQAARQPTSWRASPRSSPRSTASRRGCLRSTSRELLGVRPAAPGADTRCRCGSARRSWAGTVMWGQTAPTVDGRTGSAR